MKIVGSAKNLLRYRFLLGQLVVREIKLKYKRSVLGIVWSVLNPLLMMLIMNVVFSRLFRFDIANFLVYYLTGYLLFGLMHEATTGALYSVFGNAGLINKVYVPKYVFPVAKSISALVNFLFSLVALTFVSIFTGIQASAALLLAPLLFVMFMLFVMGFSLILATYAVYFRDLVHFHSIFMLMWMYITPIFYPESLLKDKYAWLLQFNPMIYYVRYFRAIVLERRAPSLEENLACLVIGMAFLFLGMLVFRRNQHKFSLYL